MSKEINIMVVDDDPISLEFATCSLEELGYKNLYQAKDGSDAMAQLQWAKIDLVISDWNMPYIDGLKLYAAIKRSPLLKNIKFLLMTSSSEKEKVITALKSGIKHFIVKPFDLKTLEDKLKTM